MIQSPILKIRFASGSICAKQAPLGPGAPVSRFFYCLWEAMSVASLFVCESSVYPCKNAVPIAQRNRMMIKYPCLRTDQFFTNTGYRYVFK